MADQYKQIENAVPVNLAFAIGRSLIRLFNEIDTQHHEESKFEEADKAGHEMLPPQLFDNDLAYVYGYQSEGNISNAMKKSRIFKQYVWLVTTLQTRGGLTLEELNRLWVEDGVADGNPLPRSSFNRHRDGILQAFGVVIECDQSYHY